MYFSFEELCLFSHLQVLASESEPMEYCRPPPFSTSNQRFYPINSRPSVLDVFQDLVESDLVKLKEDSMKTPNYHSNITKKESMALTQITHNKDLLVKGEELSL